MRAESAPAQPRPRTASKLNANETDLMPCWISRDGASLEPRRPFPTLESSIIRL
jgi:hypothetical protein